MSFEKLGYLLVRKLDTLFRLDELSYFAKEVMLFCLCTLCEDVIEGLGIS